MARTSHPDAGNAVRAARRGVELTQAELATQVGVSRQTIVAIENGGYAPSVYLALALGSALGRSVEDLFAPATSTHHGTEGSPRAPRRRPNAPRSTASPP